MAQDHKLVIDIPAGSNVEALLAVARRRAAEAGVELSGDGVRGRFDGAASGTYEVTGSQLHVSIEKKPAFVPWALVRSQIARAFGGQLKA